jgi:cellulose biosynthesis protein BcsQ
MFHELWVSILLTKRIYIYVSWSAQYKDIFAYAPHSNGAEDYLKLAKEMVERLEKGVKENNSNEE